MEINYSQDDLSNYLHRNGGKDLDGNENEYQLANIYVWLILKLYRKC
jgi:hypothetical protein